MSTLELPEKSNKLMRWVGFVVMTLTLMISFWVEYCFFFERTLYTRRKALYKWLKENNLPEYEKDVGFSGAKYYNWIIDGYKVILRVEAGVFKHYVFKDGKLILNSYHSGVLDSYRYRKIEDILKEAVGE